MDWLASTSEHANAKITANTPHYQVVHFHSLGALQVIERKSQLSRASDLNRTRALLSDEACAMLTALLVKVKTGNYLRHCGKRAMDREP
jgi:hypothetical protein